MHDEREDELQWNGASAGSQIMSGTRSLDTCFGRSARFI